VEGREGAQPAGLPELLEAQCVVDLDDTWRQRHQAVHKWRRHVPERACGPAPPPPPTKVPNTHECPERRE